MKKVSKFLGNLPSEQIFYRNVPLGAPEFYEDLYSSEISTSQEQFDLFIRNLVFPRLSDEDREEIEGPLTPDECKSVLELFQENKSPGEDGFTIEFYKYFFDSVGSSLG